MAEFIDVTDSDQALIITGIAPGPAHGKTKPDNERESGAPAEEGREHSADPTAEGADRAGQKGRVGPYSPPGRKG